MSQTQKLLVVYDYGSLPPTRLAAAAQQNDCGLIFATAPSQHAKEMTPYLRFLGEVVEMPASDPHKDAALVARLRAAEPTAIVTFSDGQIGTTAHLAAALDLPYHSVDDIPAITRKDGQRRRFAERGVGSVRWHEVRRPDEIDAAMAAVGFPAVAKPIRGAASRDTAILNGAEQCRDFLTTVLEAESAVTQGERGMILEEFLVGAPREQPWGDYLTADFLVQGDSVEPLFVTSKFQLAEPCRERGGYGSRSVLSDAELGAALETGREALRALNVRLGIADVDIKLTADGPRVIEVNGRLGGWVDDLGARSATVDIADVAVKSALGRDAVIPPMGDGPIAFHYVIVSPMWAHRVKAVRNVSGMTRIPHIDKVFVRARPGTDVGWRLGSTTSLASLPNSSVAAVIGSTESHGELAETIAAVEAFDWIEYE